MNCPCCKQALGDDQFAYGPYTDIAASAVYVDIRRTLYLECGHCGPQTVEFDGAGRIIARFGPYHNERDARHIRSKLPANHGRAMPA